MNEMSTLLEIKELTAGYDELEILKGVTLTVKEQEIVALIGPNGAGKSTVLKAIFNMANVTSGNIFFEGKEITVIPSHALITRGLCYVNQGKIIFGNLTVLENIMIGTSHLKKSQQLKTSLDNVYHLFPILSEKKEQLAFGLSGGQRQQLALARALMQQPKLLLLDEPSLGLSPKLQKELFKTIAHLKNDGISLLIVEQNAKKAIEIADTTYLLEDGKIVLSGGKETLKNKKIKDVYLGGRY